MANMIQCDACKCITKKADALMMHIRRSDNYALVRELEVCPRCYRKLLHTYNLDKDVKDNAD